MKMSFGNPGNLTYPVAPNVAQEFSQAQQAAPLAAAQQKQQLAEAQEGTAAAGARQAQDEIAKSQAQDQALARYASIPGIEKSPQGQKMLAERFKTLGIPMPTNEAGLPDMAAIRAIIQPPVKPWTQWTPEEVSKEMALDPSLRTLPADAPEQARTKAANVPITDAGYKALMAPVQRAEELIGKGTGNFQGLEGAALSAYNALKARGADTSVVDPYLNADHTGLSDEKKSQMAGTLVDAQIDNLHSLGIYRTDETKLRQEMIDQKKYQWDHASAYQRGQLSLGAQRIQAQASQAAAKLSIAERNLTARWASIGNSAQANQIRLGALGVNYYQNYLKQTNDAMKDGEAQLQKTNALITSMIDAGQTDSPVFTGLVNQAASLQKGIDTNAPIVDAETAKAQQGLAGIYSSVTGNPSTVVGAPPINIRLNVQTPPAAGGDQSHTSKQPTVVEVKTVNGQKWAKYSDGTYGQVP